MGLLEAMAVGVPLVVTAVGGGPDVVGSEEALLVQPENPAALANAIRRTYTDREGAGRQAERLLEGGAGENVADLLSGNGI